MSSERARESGRTAVYAAESLPTGRHKTVETCCFSDPLLRVVVSLLLEWLRTSCLSSVSSGEREREPEHLLL